MQDQDRGKVLAVTTLTRSWAWWGGVWNPAQARFQVWPGHSPAVCHSWVGVSLPLHLRGGIFKMWPSGPASLASMNYRNERVCNVLSRRGMWPVLSTHYLLTPIIKTTQKLINLARAKPIKYLLITVFVPWPEMFLRSVEENTKAGLDVRRQPMPEFPSS